MALKDITKEQAETYDILTNMALKAFFSVVVIGILITAFCYLVNRTEWSQTVPLAAIEILLTNTVYRAFKHYFPIKKEE
ncbi:hypothetical protein ACWA1C_08385 [Flectobacillus roseus]